MYENMPDSKFWIFGYTTIQVSELYSLKFLVFKFFYSALIFVAKLYKLSILQI